MKVVLFWKVSLSAHIKKIESLHISNLMMHLKSLKKHKHMMPKKLMTKVH